MGASKGAAMPAEGGQQNADSSLSTSRNILWQLNVASETDEAFHMGADVSMLSMYPAEEEVLFPPNSALQVLDPESAEWIEEGGRKFLMVDARPSFI